MKNKQTNRRLLSLLLSLCLMLSLVTPAMATGEETAGQGTEQTTACPTEIEAVETTLRATMRPEGSTLPDTITLVTPNVIRLNESDIYMEVIGLPNGGSYQMVVGEESGTLGAHEECYSYNWYYGSSLAAGSNTFTVKLRDGVSYNEEHTTVVYEMSEGESIPIYLATEEKFPAVRWCLPSDTVRGIPTVF